MQILTTKVVFYRDDNGRVPLLTWLDTLPFKARIKCVERIERLKEVGHELRRPEADYLRDGINPASFIFDKKWMRIAGRARSLL